MKKLMFVFAFILLASSWQTYDVNTGNFVVYEAGKGSAICYEGRAENYNGHCVSTPNAATSQYLKRIADEAMHGIR